MRLAEPQPLRPASLVIQRKVSSRGGIRVDRQHIQVGLPHAGRIVSIEPGDTTLRVVDCNGELLTIVPRNNPDEITRFKAHGSKHSDLPRAGITPAHQGPKSRAARRLRRRSVSERAAQATGPPLRHCARDSPAGCP